MELNKCPVCNSKKIEKLEGSKMKNKYKCKKCNTIISVPEENDEEDN
jgi:transposase-like protein